MFFGGRTWMSKVNDRVLRLPDLLNKEFKPSLIGGFHELALFKKKHVENVCELSLKIGSKLGIPDFSSECDVLAASGLFHDIGRIAQFDGRYPIPMSGVDGHGEFGKKRFEELSENKEYFSDFTIKEISEIAFLIKNHDFLKNKKASFKKLFLLKILVDADIVESVSNPQTETFGYKNNIFSVSNELMERFNLIKKKERRIIPDKENLKFIFKEYECKTAGDSLTCLLSSACKLTFMESLYELRRTQVFVKFKNLLGKDENTLEVLSFLEKSIGVI